MFWKKQTHQIAVRGGWNFSEMSNSALFLTADKIRDFKCDPKGQRGNPSTDQILSASCRVTSGKTVCGDTEGVEPLSPEVFVSRKGTFSLFLQMPWFGKVSYTLKSRWEASRWGSQQVHKDTGGAFTTQGVSPGHRAPRRG